MASYNDVTTMAGALKELYDGQELMNLVYSKNPFLAMVPKSEDFLGKSKPVPVQFANGQGGSAVFATAQSNQTANAIAEFQLVRRLNYQLATITGEAALASESSMGSFLDGFKANIDGATRNAVNEIARQVMSDGTGVRGAIGSISSGVITLADGDSVTFFEKGMVLQAGAGTASPRAALGYVIAVNRQLGKVTVSDTSGTGSAGTPASWVATDVLYRQGDKDACISGIPAWLPKTAPSGGESFYGVDRSVDSRLYGVYYDGSGEAIDEAIISLASMIGREGGSPDMGIVNFASWAALEKGLGSRVMYTDFKGEGTIGFKGIRLAVPNGFVDVFADRNMTPKTVALLQKDTWELCSLGKAPRILDLDTLEVQRVGTADAYEVRIASYANLSCNAPCWNGTATIGQ